jgi:undecaprenyl-diphosphatase
VTKGSSYFEFVSRRGSGYDEGPGADKGEHRLRELRNAMEGPPTPTASNGWWRERIGELTRLDVAIYEAIAGTPTPDLDRAFRRISRAADHSKLWIGTSVVLAAAGGASGRRAAANGLASIGLASAVANLVLKPLADRSRPDREALGVPAARRVTKPGSTSFPSGHSASAFAFATGVAAASPQTGIPLTLAASLVAYSRVHTGVHYPLDVVVGSVTGVALAPVAVAVLEHRRRSRQLDRWQYAQG